MIVEELIFFDQGKLRSVRPIQDQLRLTKDFFASFSPVSKTKLSYLIDLLRERELEERPFTYPNTNVLLSLGLVIFIIALISSFTANSSLRQQKNELLALAGTLAIARLILRFYITKKLRQRKYARLIQVLEIYHEEL